MLNVSYRVNTVVKQAPFMVLHFDDGLCNYAAYNKSTAIGKENPDNSSCTGDGARKREICPDVEAHGRPYSSQHSAGRALTSDLSVNSFMIVFYEKLFSSALDREFCLNLKKLS